MDLENIVVDITQRNYNTIQTIQYDVDSRYVNVKIVNNGKNVDLTNYMVSIACKKPDGKIVFNETEMIEPKQGLIKFLISEQISSALGEVVCELKIYGKNSSVLTTQYFTINVTQPIANKRIQSTNEFRQLTVAMNDYNVWINKVEEKYNGLEEEYAERLTEISTQLSDVIKSKRVVNVVIDYGAKGDGVIDDTNAIQKAIDELGHGQTLYFPNGTYKCGQLSISSKPHLHRTVKFLGETYLYDGDSGNGDWIGGGTIIEYTGQNGSDFIVPGSYNKPPTLIFESLIFKGSPSSSEPSFQKNQFLKPAFNNDVNNYFYVQAKDCLFYGWRNTFGEFRDIDYGGANDIAENYKLATVNAKNCTFLNNKCGITGLLDSEITNCRIVSNDYGIVLRKWMFANRIVSNRIEWNKLHGIYCYKGASIITSNEIDRSGLAGLYIEESEHSIISNNKLLRNGAHETKELKDGIDNVHIYAKKNVQCVFDGNVTVRQHQWDSGTGDIRPWKCATFIENDQCTITNNVLNGAQIKWTNPSELNLFQANKWCKIDNNIMHDNNTQTSHDSVQESVVINTGATKYVSFKNIDQMPDGLGTSQTHYLEITCVLNDSQPSYDNTYVDRIPFVLMNLGVGNNKGFIRGTPIRTIGKNEDKVIEIQDMDYFKFANSIGVNFRNPTGTNNKYYFRIY